MRVQTFSPAPRQLPCLSCFRDAGHQCGMAGAARCALIEASEAGRVPWQWRVGTESWICSDFEPGLDGADERFDA